jgi:hypothetical protein
MNGSGKNIGNPWRKRIRVDGALTKDTRIIKQLGGIMVIKMLGLLIILAAFLFPGCARAFAISSTYFISQRPL